MGGFKLASAAFHRGGKGMINGKKCVTYGTDVLTVAGLFEFQATASWQGFLFS